MKQASRAIKRSLAVVPTAAMVLIALPALADHDRDDDDDRHFRKRHVPVVYHGASCASRHAHDDRDHDRFHRKAYRKYSKYSKHHGHHRKVRRYEHAAHPFACRPCSSHFRSWQSFRSHVHQHHHVSPWRLSGLLVRYGGFWAYLG